jgi:hypothetical protein
VGIIRKEYCNVHTARCAASLRQQSRNRIRMDRPTE